MSSDSELKFENTCLRILLARIISEEDIEYCLAEIKQMERIK